MDAQLPPRHPSIRVVAPGNDSPSSSGDNYPFSAADGNEKAWKGTQARRSKWNPIGWSRGRKLLAALVLVIIVLALALGLGLGLGLQGHQHKTHTKASYLPTDGLQGSANALQQTGVYRTSKDDSNLFTWFEGGFNFGSVQNGTDGVDLVLNTSTVYQQMDGFGAALTDSATYLLANLKSENQSLYDSTMDFIFNNRTGLSIVRVPLGSCDFSLDTYTFEKRTDSGFIEQVISNTSALLSSFSLTDAHTNIMPILQDALARNPRIKLMLSPWSPPAWMKTSNSLGGGSVRDDYLNATAEYYAQAVSGFAEAGARPWALTVQNEPTQEAAYPSTLMSPQMQSALASRLRGRLGQLGFGHVKLIGHDNNYERWQDAADTINANTSALDGVGWHCYKGSSDQINQYKQALNSSADGKEVHFTECSGTITGQSRWSGMSWWLNNVFKPLTALSSRSVLVWNLALDKKGDPHLKTAICDDCAGALDISSPSHFMDPWFALGEQMYVLNHYGAAATSLEGQGGGPAYRIDVTFPGPTPSLSGSDLACLSATSFAAPVQGNAIVNPSTRKGGVRMGLILENDCDNAITIKMSVDGRRSDYGVQPGLSTLVWVAP